MSEKLLFELAAQAAAIPPILRELAGGVFLRLDSVADAAKPFLVALLTHTTARPILLVTANLKRHEQFLNELETYTRVADKPLRLLSFPNTETLPHEDILPPLDVIAERMRTLCLLQNQGGNSAAQAPVIVTTVQSLLQKTWSPQLLRQHLIDLQIGSSLDPQQLVARLEALGYDTEYRVSAKGQIAQRGGIIDLWSPDASAPLRVEFVGEQIESIRAFDPTTQQSQQKRESAVILPAGEHGLLKRIVTASERESVEAFADSTDCGLLTADSSLASLLDFLAPQTLVVFDEPDDLRTAAADYAHRIPEQDPFYISWEKVLSGIQSDTSFSTVELTESAAYADETNVSRPTQPSCHSERSEESPSVIVETMNVNKETLATFYVAGSFQGDEKRRSFSVEIHSLDSFCRIFARPPSPELVMQARKEFFSQIKRWCERGYAVFAFCPTDGELTRFRELLAEFGIGDLARCGSDFQSRVLKTSETQVAITNRSHDSAIPPLQYCITPILGSLNHGFVWNDAKIAVITDTEIFSRSRQHRFRRTRIEQARAASVAITDFMELEEGDFVVHFQHGIGRYRGLKTIEVAKQRQEVLAIEYADEARLYVPIDQAHLVSKYVGAGKRRPDLSILGGKRWSRQIADAERAVLDLAAEMLEIQAARETQEGFAFSADTSWQREFEASFIYEETLDQVRTIEETKRDLERLKPMDRLICGDVGYGKTEVAIRAAFKAVMDNKQVAVLVPTTVLAEQHWNTFRDRMAGYPVVVEMLSRFRTRSEQRAVVRGLAEGSVDIVIGTHRLLGNDIHFKDLGLVIIDEEQRFGVLHKEKLKRLRKMVDVLTLTATPIPRTLYLALTGARDMSQIQTPPQDRLPVKTIVAQYEEKTVADAIGRELARGGQVYYLHNRVQSIEAVAMKVQQLVPQARVAIGHGQMDSDALEDVMRRFVDGEVDVLVCTTIIESGLDIPNANTIIIDRADRFGLSDLYQLRGRVGRYKHQAYAYILLPRHMHLIETARKRIAAIRQYSSLGSGFKIAMRDLEIRGAGNILGAQQSGHITAVGFDLYCQLLRESVARLKGEPVKKLPHVEMRLDFLDLAVEKREQPRRSESGEGGSVAANNANGANISAHSRSSRHSRQNAASESSEPSVSSAAKTSRRKKTWLDEDTLDLEACYIPYNYISETPLRIEVYRKIAQAVSEEEIRVLSKELRDRFGTVPPSVSLLLDTAAVRIAAAQAGVDSLETEGDKLKLQQLGVYFQPDGKFPRLGGASAKGKLLQIKTLLKSLTSTA